MFITTIHSIDSLEKLKRAKADAVIIGVEHYSIRSSITVKKEDLQVKKIQRSGEEYYYISSANNTMEIQISSGKITRINSATVEE